MTVCSESTAYTEEMLVKTHAVLVKRIAHRLLMRLPQSIQLEDLMQVGMIGLLEAVKQYDKTKGASFETYAAIRIRGHMLDEIRNNDWVPRSVYRNARLIAKAVKEVENQLGRVAKDAEIAAQLQLNLDEYYLLLKEAAGSQLYGFDDLGITDDVLKEDRALKWEPHTIVMHEALSKQLSQVIAGLPQKERLVLSLYYEQDLNLKEIGAVLGVSESRVSQIHTQAALRIRARLQTEGYNELY